ncbi:MAG: hypothetical protein WCC52_00350 [Nitrosotalea sp.]
MVDTKIDWFDDFLGLGYHMYDVKPTIFLMFNGRKKVGTTWNQILKYFPDDEIKIRFVEKESNYDFILYCQSRILSTTWVFLKSLKISEHYKQFKEDYEGAANLKLALYIPKKDTYELEIFKYMKRITNLKFPTESEVEQDFILSRSIEALRSRSVNTDGEDLK